MREPLRILLTGFGPFPGAPYNPTPALVERLIRLRRPALGDIARSSHIFDVSYGAVDHDLPLLVAQHRPHALLMFGLATRTPFLRIETRARNAVTRLWPDAAHTQVRSGVIARDQEALMIGRHTARLAHVARASGIDARQSRDAGRYLCNYLSYRAIEAGRRDACPKLVAFVHVPLTARDGRRWRGEASRMSLDEMTDAGEAVLVEMVAQTRRLMLTSG